MKALSIWQPWASLLMADVKSYETRNWSPPRDLIGDRIAIHASKTAKGLQIYTDAMEDFANAAMHSAALAIGYSQGKPLPFGCILGTARIAFILQTDGEYGSEVLPDERALGDWSAGRYAWRLTDHEPLATPIPYRGQQGLFDIPDHIIPGATR